MPKLQNGRKVGFKPELYRLRVRHSTAQLPTEYRFAFSETPREHDYP